mmetsp:Transcript_39466/g.54810  ORF Transcript_39466/g.54810 Transcript_39466/m.54810 type:complete len:532 (-) Transcript_39466:133-1728(-)|eukprot:CAMPEP_0196587886 /NCGR_PEP_ID=MMETSP1081-20130531/58932_1 /TAXON_ID=36882 /ORGANISM="Pyramimonas amylifera, Strain CCMP720" /LENGTH=531 /DNA_ID=CAMNT_0041910215 /DNA_START=221 /DNA_END=1816 /DNA_ORIENTATION=-
MQTLFEQQRLHYEQEKAQVAQEQRMRELLAEKRARELKERQDKLGVERKRKMEAARELREMREKEESAVLETHRFKQQQVLSALNQQKEAFMQHHMELRSVAQGNFMGGTRAPGLSGSAVTFEQVGAKQWRAVVDVNSVNDDDEFKMKRSEMQEEMKNMRTRMAAEKEKLLAEMDKRRRALQDVRIKTGVEAREVDLTEREERERIQALLDKEKQEAVLNEIHAREHKERVEREREHKELEVERRLRLELEKRTLEAELVAEKAKFELEKMQMREKLSQANARSSETGTNDAHNNEALEQIRVAMEAERQAQELLLKGEQQRMQEMMAKERSELEARLEQEKKELMEKLEKKQAKKEKAEESKSSIEQKIADTLKMFQAQLQMQQEQIASRQQGFNQQVPDNSEKLAWAHQQTAVVPHKEVPVKNGPGAMIAQEIKHEGHKLPAGEEPSYEEIAEYAVYLGMNPEEDQDLLYIAEWALTAPLPDGWTEHSDASGNEFYYNKMTGVSTYEHPLDEHYRAYYRRAKDAELAKA